MFYRFQHAGLIDKSFKTSFNASYLASVKMIFQCVGDIFDVTGNAAEFPNRIPLGLIIVFIDLQFCKSPGRARQCVGDRLAISGKPFTLAAVKLIELIVPFMDGLGESEQFQRIVD